MANKKINQLVSKTSILSTDLFGIGDATTGQLFKKTIAELQAAIGGAVISVNGLVGTVVLDTDDIQELATPTNKYFTDARARAAISLTVTGNSGASTYSSGTGVLNVPTYTLAGLGGITASFLSGTSGISYNSTTGVITYSGTVYTDASIRALFSGATGISYNSTTGAISYSGTVYTDSSVRALISLTTTGNSGASTYNNTTGVINVPEYTLAGLGGISLTSLSGGTGITYNSSTGAISYSGTVYTDASIRALISASGSVSYNNTTGVISLTGGNLTEATSSVLTITGGSGAVIGGGTSIQVKQATTSVSGFLSSTDWTTFNNKQATITLTTTGTSGAATFSSNTLNIPNYGSALSGYLPLTGGTLTGALGGTSASFTGNVILSSGGDNLTLARTGFTSFGFGVGTVGGINGLHIGAGASTYLSLNQSTGAFTLTGALSGTSATFSGNIISSAGNFAVFNGGSIEVYNTGTTNYFDLKSTGGNFALRTNVGSSAVNALTIASTGAATFSSNVIADGLFRSNQGIFQVYGVGTFRGGLYNYAQSAGSGSDYSPTLVSETDLYFTTGGSSTKKVVITSTGNVGIKTTTAFSTSEAALFIGASNSINIGGIGAAGNYSNNAYYNGSDWKYISSSFGGVNYYQNDGTHNWRVAGTGTAGNNITWIEAMRITSGGNMLMGTTTDNGERLYVSGAIRATSTITANSDITLKKNLLKIENALEKVEQINGYTYEFKADDSKRHAGVIAQEIQTVLPEIVNKGNDGILGVEYGNISALLIEAIKEQNIKIKNLETLLASK